MVRSSISSFSNWATEPSTLRVSLPVGPRVLFRAGRRARCRADRGARRSEMKNHQPRRLMERPRRGRKRLIPARGNLVAPARGVPRGPLSARADHRRHRSQGAD
jgi:hypothetical protein